VGEVGEIINGTRDKPTTGITVFQSLGEQGVISDHLFPEDTFFVIRRNVKAAIINNKLLFFFYRNGGS
jgi:hypothetical protein